MIDRKFAEPVILYLRAITYDGKLSSREIWELAQWLNTQTSEVREKWPAKPLIEALKSAFADSVLTESEMVELADTIVAIEQLWIESLPLHEEPFVASPDATSTSMAGVVGKPMIPAVGIHTTVAADDTGASYEIDLENHTCTCADFAEYRAEFPTGDYRRCCMHIAQTFASFVQNEQKHVWDPLFLAFIVDHGRRGRGVSVDQVWQIVKVDGSRVLYGASPGNEWVSVFAPAGSGFEPFGYNRKAHRWAYGAPPKALSSKIAALFSPTFQDQPAASET